MEGMARLPRLDRVRGSGSGSGIVEKHEADGALICSTSQAPAEFHFAIYLQSGHDKVLQACLHHTRSEDLL